MLQHLHSQPTKPRRVVILGASGFVARDLARHLSEKQIEHRAIGSGEIDLLKPESVHALRTAVREDDALVVTSGLTPDKGRDIPTLMKNLAMAQHLATVLEETPLSQVIYISSDAVYDGREPLIRESSACQPSDLFSLMHLAREQILSFATAKAKTPTCILRPCAIYGAGDTHNSYGPNRFFRTALKDRRITLFGQGEEIRDHVYIEDVSRLAVLCLTHRSAGILNAVSGAAVSFNDVAARIATLCGQTVAIEHLPRSSPVTHRQFDATDRIKAFPAFVPTSLDDGLAASFKGMGGLPPSPITPPEQSRESTVHAAPHHAIGERASAPPQAESSRLIIVGKNSYIGSCLVEYAGRAGLTNIQALSSEDCNFLNLDEVAKFFRSLPPGDHTVVFLAVVNKSLDASFQAFLDNVRIVKNLREACRMGPIGSLIYFSSVDVYGQKPQLPITEQSRVSPDSWYGMAKQVCEWILCSPDEMPCPVTVLRIPGIYGRAQNDRSVLGNFAKGIKNNGKITIRGEGTTRRDYVYVEDVCRIVIELLPKHYHGTLNVASGRSYSIADFARLVGQQLSRKFEIVHLPVDTSRDFDLVFDNKQLLSLLPDFQFSDLSASLRSYRDRC